MLVHKLEDELGIEIFNRNRKPVIPTPIKESALVEFPVFMKQLSLVMYRVFYREKLMEEMIKLIRKNLPEELKKPGDHVKI